MIKVIRRVKVLFVVVIVVMVVTLVTVVEVIGVVVVNEEVFLVVLTLGGDGSGGSRSIKKPNQNIDLPLF